MSNICSMEISSGALDLRYGVFDSRVDLRQLGALFAIGQTGSLAGAARLLSVSQPTIAHHLDTLETVVGAALVERGPRGAHLNDLGQLLVIQAEGVLDRLASAITEVRGLASAGVATMRVGTFSSAGALLLPEAIGEVRRRTTVRIELREAETIDLLADIDTGALHVALVYNDGADPLPIPEGWRVRTLGWDRYLLAVPDASGSGSGGPPVRLADYADEGWILSRIADPSADRGLLAAAASAGFSPRPVLRTDDFHVALGFVAAGLGVTIVPQMAIEDRPGVRFVEIADHHLGRTIGVVHPEQPPIAVDILVAALIERAPEVLGEPG